MLLYFYCHCERAVCASVAIAFMVLCHCERFSICHCEEGFLFVIARRAKPDEAIAFLILSFYGGSIEGGEKTPFEIWQSPLWFFPFCLFWFHGKYRRGHLTPSNKEYLPQHPTRNIKSILRY
jgi:hypothetical protein